MPSWPIRFGKRLLSPRVIRFLAVGFSGVFVNLGVLAVFAHGLDAERRLASAFAIEISILWNFFFNNAWTFRDRNSSASAGFFERLLRYNLVSLVGGGVQWATFVLGTALAVSLLGLREPGLWIYPAQLAGIAVAMVWNFVSNFYWTWAQQREKPATSAAVVGAERPDLHA